MEQISHKETIVATDPDGRIYVQHVRIYDVDGIRYKGQRYEIWASMDHYRANTPGDGRHIYCRGFGSLQSPDEFLAEYGQGAIPQ